MRIAYTSVAAFKSKANLLCSLLGIQKTTEGLELLAKLSGYTGYFEVARTAPAQDSTGTKAELVARLQELRPGLAKAGAQDVIEKLGLRTADASRSPSILLVDTSALRQQAVPLYTPHPGQFRPQAAYVEIDRLNGTVNVGSSAFILPGTPWPVWEGPFVRLAVHPLIRGAALADLLEESNFQERVRLIAAGSQSESLTRDARDNIEILETILDVLSDNPQNRAELGDVGSYMQDRISEERGAVFLQGFGVVAATSTDEELAGMARAIASDAGRKGIALLASDVAEWLADHRAGCQESGAEQG